MKKSILTTMVIVALVQMTSCSLTDNRESKVNEYLQERVNSESKGILKLDKFKKTNGYSQDVMGTTIYVLEWEADISTNQNIWKFGNGLVGYWQSFRVMTTQPGYWDAYVAGGGTKYFGAGTLIHLTGESKLQKTDNGWRVGDYSVKTSQIVLQTSTSVNSPTN